MKKVNVESISYEVDQGYPVLICTIDGVKAWITHEQKPTLTAYQIIFIGPQFSETHVLYPKDVPPELRPLLQGEPLRGFVRDKDFYENIWLPFALAMR